ncbi:MAG: class I SAM-dependent methyltransferase [bacterium]
MSQTDLFGGQAKKRVDLDCPCAYKGITAQLYDLWFDVNKPFEDLLFYQKHIRKNGGIALEIASGTGRLLLPYLREGMNVEGLEPSLDMNNICLEKAENFGVKPVLHPQAMESMKISLSYKTIYIPLFSFQLLVKRSDIFEALRRFYLHLEKNGQLLIALFIPEASVTTSQDGTWKIRSKAGCPEDGSHVVVSEATIHNQFDQIQNKWFRYEIYNGGEQVIQTIIKTVNIRWYYPYEFTIMLEKIGFRDVFIYGDYTDEAANNKSETLIFSARR